MMCKSNKELAVELACAFWAGYGPSSDKEKVKQNFNHENIEITVKAAYSALNSIFPESK